MASFTTRVELHDSNISDYSNLHKFMTEAGFSKNIVSDDGIIYELPNAEYNITGTMIRGEVLDKTKEVVKKWVKALLSW